MTMEKEKTNYKNAREILASRESLSVQDVLDFFNDPYSSERVEFVAVGVFINDKTKAELFSLGFKYNKSTNPMGETIHIISVE